MTDLAADVDRCERGLALQLERTATPAEMLDLDLHPAEVEGPSAGTRPAVMLVDGRGRRFFFKAAEPTWWREVFATA